MSDELELRRPRSWVRAEIEKRVSVGRELLSEAEKAPEIETLKALRDRYQSWTEYNWTLLSQAFGGPIRNEYFAVATSMRSPWAPAPSFEEMRDDLCDHIRDKVRRLESICDRLELLDDPVEAAPPATGNVTTSPDARKPLREDAVFVVHGHGDAAKHEVTLWLDRLGLTPIILHERPNEGRTIIEKFFEEAGDVGYAVVIATGDDEARAKGATDFARRPRQNVVLELGFFLGKLGRDKVAVLREPDVELPSDYDGVVYIDLDGAGGWKLGLAKELATAGLSVDPSKLIDS